MLNELLHGPVAQAHRPALRLLIGCRAATPGVIAATTKSSCTAIKCRSSLSYS